MKWINIKPCTVYGIQCDPNGKIYIGCTCYLEERIKQHFRELEKGEKIQSVKGERFHRIKSPFQEDYDKFGKSAFKVIVLEENVKPEDRFNVEQEYINKFDALNANHGYNLAVAKSKT